jgi:hypothetical protein
MRPVETGCVPSNTPALPADATATGHLSPPQQHALAERYAPVLYFHPDERHFLQDPNTFLEQSSLRAERDFRGDEELHGVGEVPAEELAGIDEGNKTADSALFLDHSNETLGDGIRAGDLDNSLNLYSYGFNAEANGGKGAHEITYYLFYAYNDGPPEGIGEVQNHEGDWERVTIQLDPETNQPLEVRYSAHVGANTVRTGSEIPMEDGRPVVYVGKGSHASYPEAGQWHTDGPGVHDYTSDDGIRFDLSTRPATDVTTQPWYGSYVQWGERGTSSEIPDWLPGAGAVNGVTSGPTGPSPGKGAVGDATERQPLSDLESPPPPPSLTDRLRDLLPDYNGPVPDLPNLPDLPDLPDLPNLDPRDLDLPDIEVPDLDVPDREDLDPRNWF